MMEEKSIHEKVYELSLKNIQLREGQSLPELGITFSYRIEESREDKLRRELLEKLVDKEIKKARERIVEAIEKEAVDARQCRMFFSPKESFIKSNK